MSPSRNEVDDDFKVATRMTLSAMAFYDSLSASQRERVVMPFASENRRHWRFLPESGRGDFGIAVRELDNHQTSLLHRIITSSVSVETYAKLLATFCLESVLREINQPALGHIAMEFRDPTNYYLTFFDAPQPDQLWAWRLVGHHVSLNFTSLEQDAIAGTPFLIGSEPGRFGVFRNLADEEDRGFALLRSLDPEQLERAVIHDQAPADFVTRTVPVIGDRELPDRHGIGRRDVVIEDVDREALAYERTRPRGVSYGDLAAEQQQRFDELLTCYLARVHPLAMPRALAQIVDAGKDELHFAWAGGTDFERGHYYRIQGPVTLIEFNNTEDNANHVHSVWRDPVNDFGGGA
jgi:hypothetical protein